MTAGKQTKPDCATSEASPHPRFILIQIDGISCAALIHAMEKGYAPTIRKLINKKGCRLVPYHCPPPSNTPYFQTGLMYGNNSGVLGFRWMEKKEGLRVTFKDAASAALVEERASAGRKGILSLGSSYLNLFSGDAERAVFTLSTFAKRNLWKKRKLRQLDIFLLFFLVATNVLRTCFFLAVDTFLEFGEWLSSILSRQMRRREGIFPAIRLINNVIIREIETLGAVTDIGRGVPSLHITYNGYDEIAHHRGPTHPAAFRILRGIDRKIRKIVDAASRSRQGKYDVYIFSDHGQTPSVPFAWRYGETLAELIQRTTPETLEISEFNAPHEAILHEAWKYLEEFTFYTLNLPRFVHNVAERLRALVVRRHPQVLPFEWLKEREQVFVNDSGPLSHLYFNYQTDRIPFREIEKRHPELFRSLVEHPGIGVVIGCDEKGKTVILKWEENLPADYKESLIALAREPNAGDLIIQGAFDGDTIINFEEQLSGHGGAGGDQNRPFFLLPSGCTFDPAAMENPREFYPFFFENYTKYAIREQAEAIHRRD